VNRHVVPLLLSGAMLCLHLALPSPVIGQAAAQGSEDPLRPEELDQLLAPIARPTPGVRCRRFVAETSGTRRPGSRIDIIETVPPCF
jgi:hypothetical protein